MSIDDIIIFILVFVDSNPLNVINKNKVNLGVILETSVLANAAERVFGSVISKIKKLKNVGFSMYNVPLTCSANYWL